MNRPPVLLAIETATEACAVALVQGDVVHARTEEVPRGHSRRLLPLADELLAAAGVSRSSVDAVAYGAGPGGFLGVRMAASVAQAFCLAWAVPAVPVCTLRILAEGAFRRSGESTIGAVLDARMDAVYWARLYRAPGVDGEPVTLEGPALASPEAVPAALGDGYGVGRGWGAYAGRLPDPARGCDPEALPDARDLARLAAQASARNEGVDPERAEPLYLREAVQSRTAPSVGASRDPASARHSS